MAPRLRCGLGNRLFQTMAAIGKAEAGLGKPVFLLPRMSQEHGNFDLIFQLFPNIPIIETAATWEEVDEENINKIPQESLLVLSGFFQDTKYFPQQTSPYLPRLPGSEFIEPKDSWAIHFRFGDYQILKHYHVDLSRYYFYTITTKIPKGSSITIFSDSPDRLPPIVKEIESLGYKVEIFNNIDILQTLKAFSACVRGSICSNSTFSWWAAYFSWKTNGCKAYFPNVWIVDEEPLNLFNQPFTQSIDLISINAVQPLLSFSHS